MLSMVIKIKWIEWKMEERKYSRTNLHKQTESKEEEKEMGEIRTERGREREGGGDRKKAEDSKMI